MMIHMKWLSILLVLAAMPLSAQTPRSVRHGGPRGAPRTGLYGHRGYCPGRVGCGWGIPAGYLDPSWDDDSYEETAPNDEASQAAPETGLERLVMEPPAEPQVIDVPAGESGAAPAPLPTVFVLRQGARIESQSYLLTSEFLILGSGTRTRKIPRSELDEEATVNANQERGIALRIPAGSNEVSLSF
jgi:hypothetical protein